MNLAYGHPAIITNANCFVFTIYQDAALTFYLIILFHNITVAALNIKMIINKIMNKLPIILISILILAVFLSGCIGQGGDAKERAKTACIQKCGSSLSAGQDLSNGPCLDNKIIEGWACDVAHSPRQAVDDNPANQCSEFGKTIFNFIEVDPSCNFIKAFP